MERRRAGERILEEVLVESFASLSAHQLETFDGLLAKLLNR
jgi:hypothetical protein